MKYHLYLVMIVGLIACNTPKKKPVIEEVRLEQSVELDVPNQLSTWDLFEQPLNKLIPKKDILPYELNTPLFTDYALKSRFIKIPDGNPAEYVQEEVMDFPKGTILIKNFYYESDLTLENSSRKLIETRLLIHENDGWNALTYVWNEEQTDAYLEISGATIPVSWVNEQGVAMNVNYSVPNLVQCKSCHELSGKMTPIGPTARQLNKKYDYASGNQNQIDKWKATGMLTSVPPLEEVPKLPAWNDPSTGTTAQRARAWLDINCAHCHRLEGPAKNSGLYLRYSETDEYRLGVNKPPVAAGRGSGGMKYAIVPGHPEQSILIHRMESLDPGVMMPELGRKLVHKEGVELVKRWISEM